MSVAMGICCGRQGDMSRSSRGYVVVVKGICRNRQGNMLYRQGDMSGLLV